MNYDEDTVKILFRLKSGQIIKPGWYLPRKAIISDALPNKSFILAPGKPKNKIQKDSTKISIEAIDYIIGIKSYDLSSGYCIEAVLEHGRIVPILREAVGAEKFSEMKLVKKPRKVATREGNLVKWWPKTTKIKDKQNE